MRHLTIHRAAAEAIRANCRACYPDEACGLLAGADAPDGRRVVEAVAMRNVAPLRRRRFKLDPLEHLTAEREIEARGLSVVGFYHSHPDAEAVPSATDAAEAWPFYSYVIVPVRTESIGDPRSWSFDESRGSFDEESIVCFEI